MSNVSNNTLELKKYMYHMNKEKISIKILLNIPIYHSINKINIYIYIWKNWISYIYIYYD